MASEPKEQKPNFFSKLLNLFRHSKSHLRTKKEEELIHLEPKYWPEVREFMKDLNKIVEAHTIDDANLQSVNQRILDYVLNQINIKGSLEDIELRYKELHTLADRILVKSLDKIVGLKVNPTTHADFSEAVEKFKKQLHIRHQAELKQQKTKAAPSP